ncbi:MAG: hypothetical protein P4L51_09300 [Puia sp.]|nr:hypothetical protein [Puia sp.]
MKPPVTTDPANGAPGFSSVRIIHYPRTKKMQAKAPVPPDDETLQRLNEMAKKYPFCILHRKKDNNLL